MSHPRTARPRVLALGVLAGLTTLAMTGTFAPPASADEPGASPMEQALAESQGISVREARELITTEAALSETAEDLDARLGDSSSAGSWVEGDTLVVAVTTPDAAAEVRAAGASPEMVGRSRAQLEVVQAELDRLGRRAAGKAVSWSIDPQANAVSVQVAAGADDARTRAFVAAAEELGAEVTTTEAEVVPAATLLGGQEYTFSSGGGTYTCSTGFNARSSTGANVLITAGHCTEGATAFRFQGTSLGSAGVTSFPTDDYGTIRTSTAHTPRGAVSDWAGGSVRVTGSTEAAIGATLCKSGRTTGWTCGRVTSKNATVNYGGGDVVGGLTAHDACVMQGDSGGSNLSGTQAQGVSSGGALYDTGSGLVCGERVGQRNQSYFQPVNEVLRNQRLTLLTS